MKMFWSQLVCFQEKGSYFFHFKAVGYGVEYSMIVGGQAVGRKQHNTV